MSLNHITRTPLSTTHAQIQSSIVKQNYLTITTYCVEHFLKLTAAKVGGEVVKFDFSHPLEKEYVLSGYYKDNYTCGHFSGPNQFEWKVLKVSNNNTARKEKPKDRRENIQTAHRKDQKKGKSFLLSIKQ